MTFKQMLPALRSQSSRIFLGDKDLMQDALAMTYVNYQNCLANYGRQLSIGECVNHIKYRSSELKNATRPHFGNLSEKRTNDVYHRGNYLNGKVERLSFDFFDDDSEESDHGFVHWISRVKSPESEILFGIDFRNFQGQLSEVERDMLAWRIDGYSVREIANKLEIKQHYARNTLFNIGAKFCEYFQCVGFAV